MSLARVLGAALTLSVVCSGATVTVDLAGGGDFTDIQPALDAASDGDTVLVSPGEYVITAPLDFNRLHAPDDPCKQRVAHCMDAGDANDDGTINIADAIAVLDRLFGGAGPLPEPFEECGLDPTADALGCDSHAVCE